MTIIVLNVLFLLLGAVLVLKGADFLTDGASAIATRLRISEIVIGLTVVAIGTSMPEFFVSFVSALNDTPDMAIGNVLGSNTFNMLMIVGVAALVAPMQLEKQTVVRDLRVMVAVSGFLIVLTYDGTLSRLDAIALFLAFIAFILNTIRVSKGSNAPEDTGVPSSTLSFAKSAVFLVLGFGGLVLGANLFVNGATEIARILGVSDAIIGLTIVALGTSLPEFAASVVAARKGQSGLAIGNVIGSCVFNILMVLGVCGTISPMTVSGITIVDYAVMFVGALMLWQFSFTKYRIERWEGFILTFIYIAYVVWLVSQQF